MTWTYVDPRRGVPVRVHGSAFPDGTHRLGYIDDRQNLPGVTRVRMDPSCDVLGTFPFASRSLLRLDTMTGLVQAGVLDIPKIDGPVTKPFPHYPTPHPEILADWAAIQADIEEATR